VVSIHLASRRAGPSVEAREARAVPGSGIEGDRHFGNSAPDRQLTLIEAEAIEALQRDYQVAITAGDARRQVVTRGVPLNHLPGREFQIGAVRARGIRLCEPCEHLASLTQASVLKGLVHRGGLRAEILTEGVIRPGDEVTPA